MTSYAIVLARGGSKGLASKNVRLLAGHPLIAWSIAAARASRAVDRVICSTDSEEIANIARIYGAQTPFMRPAELAADFSTDLDVFCHAVSWLAEHGEQPDLLVQMRPTTPFRDPAWIDQAIGLMKDDPAITCVRSVAVAEHTPYKMWRLAPGGATLEPVIDLPEIPEAYNMPRQKLPVTYRHTGQLDVIRRETILAGSMTGPVIAPLIVDTASAVDIDGLRDFQMAELIFGEAMPESVVREIAQAL